MALTQDPKGPRSREGQLADKPLLATVGLVAGVLSLTSLVFGLVLYALDPSAAQLSVLNAAVGVLGLIVYAVTNRSALRRVASGRSTALILLEGVLVLGLVAAVVAANWVASQSTQEWDLTRDGLYTLEEQSIDVATRLDQDVTIIGFFKPSDAQRKYLSTLVELYQRHTSRIRLELPNVDTIPPATAKKYQLTEGGPRIVVAVGDRQTKVRGPNEDDLTNALVRVAQREPRRVRVLTGHEEPRIDDPTGDTGLGKAAQALLDAGHQVEPLSLVEASEVPAGTAVLLVGGPNKALFANELEAIERFLTDGGRVVVLVDPGVDSGLDALLLRWGAKLGQDLVVDPNPAAIARGFGADAPVVTQLEAHPITTPLRGGAALMFFWVRSVTPAITEGNLSVSTLALTSPTSWAETRFALGGEAEKDDDDLAGPVPIAVAVHKVVTAGQHSKEARLVVVGDSSFATNRFYGVGANGDLFLNAVSWGLGEEDRIKIRPKQRGATRVPLTERELYGIIFFSVNLLPLGIMGFGFSVWAVRRRR